MQRLKCLNEKNIALVPMSQLTFPVPAIQDNPAGTTVINVLKVVALIG